MNTRKNKHFQVVICGAGPSGLMLANLLGGRGIHTLVVERNAATVTEPRAVSIDDEALRTAQAAGLVDDVLANVMLDYGSYYFSPAGKCFAKVEPTTREYGYPRRNAFRQPLLEATLRQGLKRFDHVGVWFQHDLTGFQQHSDRVDLTLRSSDGLDIYISADYLAAADGGRSFVRTALDIPFTGSSFEQRWLIIDLIGTKDSFRHTKVFSNPARPGICLPGPDTTRRFEFMLRDNETVEEAESEDFCRDLMRRHGPDGDTEIVRRQVYTFHARKAERWREGRIFLLGDAAHLTPPFAGQGMNSGIRDAHNLAWKLAAVLKKELPEPVLDSYELERVPHAWALIELALTIGRVMVPRSNMHAWLRQRFLWALSLCPPAKRYVTEMRFKPKPHYRDGFLAEPLDSVGKTTIGRMLPQPIVETTAGGYVLLDTVLGDGFSVVLLSNEPATDAIALAGLPDSIRQICVTDKAIMPKALQNMTIVRDHHNGFRNFAEPGRQLLFLVRPDRYIADAFELPAVSNIAARLRRLFV